MKKPLTRVTASILLMCIIALIFSRCSNNDGAAYPLSYVDPQIGGVGLLLQPTRPTVQLPNQFIRVYPVRRDYLDDRIRFFPLSIISHRNGELFGIMPFTGNNPVSTPVSSWDQGLEISTPYYLSTWLEDFDITVEFAPGKKAGCFRFTFPDTNEKGLYLPNTRNGGWKQITEKAVGGEDSFNGMKAYVYGEVNCDFDLKDAGLTGRNPQYLLLKNEDKQNY